MTTNILQHKCCATITVIFFSFNEVSDIRKACSPPSLLQPLQSVCQPSFIQPEIFLSVGSLLSLNGMPPPKSPPRGQNLSLLVFLTSCTVIHSPSQGNLLDMDGDTSAWLLCGAANVGVFSELCDECAGFIAFNQSSYSTVFSQVYTQVSATHQRSYPGCERTPIHAYFWLKLSRRIDCKRN